MSFFSEDSKIVEALPPSRWVIMFKGPPTKSNSPPVVKHSLRYCKAAPYTPLGTVRQPHTPP